MVLDPKEFAIKTKIEKGSSEVHVIFSPHKTAGSLVNAVRPFCLPLCVKLLLISGNEALLWGHQLW